jgi:hypothetical protein
MVMYEAAQRDRRSYRVDFSMFRSLAQRFHPHDLLATSLQGMRDGLLVACIG